ncbi:MAG TPA: O-antigen ligase family protein [Steroidobacteraceae bacterium]
MERSSAQPESAVGADSSLRALRFALLAAPLIGATFLSKFGFPPLAAQGLGVSIFFLLAALAAGAVLGGVSIEPRRLALFAAMIGILGLIQIFEPDSFSPTSLLLLVAVHLPYVFTVPGGDDKDRIIKFFLGTVTIFAWCGIAQFCLEFFVNPRFLFPIENFTPDSFIVKQFHHQAAMEYGSQEYRANGVFLLEPSFFSQVLAVGIIAELCTLGRISRVVLYGLALIVSYSGTGIIVLAVCLPLCLVAQRRWGLLVVGLLIVAVIISLQLSFHANRLLSRISELDSHQSSGYARFIGGFRLFDKFLWQDPWRALFGYGAGSFLNYSARVHYAGIAEMALFKIVFEFGLVGAVAYFGFLFGCLYCSSAPRLLILAVAMTYFLNGIYVPFAHGLALSLLLWNSAPGGIWSGASAANLPVLRGIPT